MNAVTAAAMERLQRVLDAPVTGPSRHAQVAEVAEQHAADEPRIGIVTKQVAVEPVAEDVTGEFEAVVSDFLPDRQMETFVPGAFDNAVAKIRKSGKATPVLFGHSQDTIGAVLGMVPSTGWRVDHEGLHANGWLDVSEPLGQKMYRMLKSGALQWSIGFTISKTRPGRAGITELIEVDELLELSVVPVPANERTRTTTAKHLDPDREAPSLDELRARERELGLEDPAVTRIREEMADQIRLHVNGNTKRNGHENPPELDGKALRAKAERIARECAPIQVASFEC